jgi:hypothetical protein
VRGAASASAHGVEAGGDCVPGLIPHPQHLGQLAATGAWKQVRLHVPSCKLCLTAWRHAPPISLRSVSPVILFRPHCCCTPHAFHSGACAQTPIVSSGVALKCGDQYAFLHQFSLWGPMKGTTGVDARRFQPMGRLRDISPSIPSLPVLALAPQRWHSYKGCW